MFERFTDRARRVVILAQEDARVLCHNYIGTEHILLGLLHEGEGVAPKALTALGIALDAVRHDVEVLIGQGQAAPAGHIPFTPRAKKVLELSLREALQLGNNYIGTEHILLGLIREGNGVASQILRQHLGDTAHARTRQAVIEILTQGKVTPEERPAWITAGNWAEEQASAVAAAADLETERPAWIAAENWPAHHWVLRRPQAGDIILSQFWPPKFSRVTAIKHDSTLEVEPLTGVTWMTGPTGGGLIDTGEADA